MVDLPDPIELEARIAQLDEYWQKEFKLGNISTLAMLPFSLYEEHMLFFTDPFNVEVYYDVLRATMQISKDIQLFNANEILENTFGPDARLDHPSDYKHHWKVDNKAAQFGVLSSPYISTPSFLGRIQRAERDHFQELFKNTNNITSNNAYAAAAKEWIKRYQQMQQGAMHNNAARMECLNRKDILARPDTWNLRGEPFVQHLQGIEVFLNIYADLSLQSRGLAYVQIKQKTAESIRNKVLKQLMQTLQQEDGIDRMMQPDWIYEPFQEPITDYFAIEIATTDIIIPGKSRDGTVLGSFDTIMNSSMNSLLVEMDKDEYTKTIQQADGSKERVPRKVDDVRLIKYLVAPHPDRLLDACPRYSFLTPQELLYDYEPEQMEAIVKKQFAQSVHAKTLQDMFCYHLGPRAHENYKNRGKQELHHLRSFNRRYFDNAEQTVMQALPVGRFI